MDTDYTDEHGKTRIFLKAFPRESVKSVQSVYGTTATPKEPLWYYPKAAENQPCTIAEMIKANEVLLKENDEWLHFANPYQVISVQDMDEVLPALREIERLIALKSF